MIHSPGSSLCKCTPWLQRLTTTEITSLPLSVTTTTWPSLDDTDEITVFGWTSTPSKQDDKLIYHIPLHQYLRYRQTYTRYNHFQHRCCCWPSFTLSAVQLLKYFGNTFAMLPTNTWCHWWLHQWIVLNNGYHNNTNPIALMLSKHRGTFNTFFFENLGYCLSLWVCCTQQTISLVSYIVLAGY